jgi:hypothetical protein
LARQATPSLVSVVGDVSTSKRISSQAHGDDSSHPKIGACARTTYAMVGMGFRCPWWLSAVTTLAALIDMSFAQSLTDAVSSVDCALIVTPHRRMYVCNH